MAQNQLIFTDEFNGSGLDAAWQVTLRDDVGNAGTNGWDFDVNLTQPSYLTVRDITAANPVANDWRIVDLDRAVPPLGNFHITIRIAWNSDGPAGQAPILANQRLFVEVLDGTGFRMIGNAGFNDSWGNDFGTRTINGCCIAPSSLPASGSALVEVDRTGTTLTFVWDGSVLHTQTISTQGAETIRIQFSHFGGADAHMGTLSVDSITVEGTLRDNEDDCPNSDLSPTVVIPLDI